MTGSLGHDSRDRIAGTGQPGQESRAIKIWTGRLTGQPGKDREDTTARINNGVRRTVDKVVWAGQLEQDSRDRRARTRQPPPGQDISNRTSGTGHWERTA